MGIRPYHLLLPQFTPVSFREDNLWKWYPEDTNALHELAKRCSSFRARHIAPSTAWMSSNRSPMTSRTRR